MGFSPYQVMFILTEAEIANLIFPLWEKMLRNKFQKFPGGSEKIKNK